MNFHTCLGSAFQAKIQYMKFSNPVDINEVPNMWSVVSYSLDSQWAWYFQDFGGWLSKQIVLWNIHI